MSAIPWWRSKVIVGGAISLLATILKATGLVNGIDNQIVAQVTDIVLVLAAGGGAATAVGARITQTQAPLITASKGAAEVLTQAKEIVDGSLVNLDRLDDAGKMADAFVNGEKVEVPSWMLR